MERINFKILAFVFFFLSVSLLILVLEPKYKEIKDLKNALSEWEKALQDKREYFKKLEEDFERLKDFEDSLAKIDTALPKDPSPISFFNNLWNLSQANGLFLKEIGKFSVSPSKEIKEVKEIDTSFTVLGSYSALKNFIFALERSARIVKITNLSFKAPPAAEGIFDFSISVKFYSL